MVFKVFCDITVSHITNEDLCDNENICYEFVQKFDDNKENWDPNDPKKHSSVSTPNSVPSPNFKKEQHIEIEQEISKSNGKNTVLEKVVTKKNKIEEKENSIPEVDNEKENVKDKEIKLEAEIKKEENENNEKSVSSTSSSNDTIELKEEKSENSENAIDLVKKGLLGKRQRMPLEDITYLFVPEMRVAKPKRVKVVKDEECKSPEASIAKVLKTSKPIPQKENKESVNVHKVQKIFSENTKENKQPVRKTPLGNIINYTNTTWLLEFFYPIVQFQPRDREVPMMVIYKNYY